MRGLGFRVRKLSNSLFRFFFTSVNYFYLHSPKNVLVKIRKENCFLFRIMFVFCVMLLYVVVFKENNCL